jgi:transposase InsO family protein
MFHSDRGVLHTSITFKKVIERNGMVQSMSRTACFLQINAVAESFFGRLNQKLMNL